MVLWRIGRNNEYRHEEIVWYASVATSWTCTSWHRDPSVMEVDAMSSRDGSSETKRIHLLVTPDAGAGSTKLAKADVAGSDQTTSVFLYSTDGQLVPAEIVMDNLSENIITVPLENSIVKKDRLPSSLEGSSPLRVLESPGSSPKKQKNGPIITVRRTRPLHSDRNNKFLPSIIRSKPRQVACSSVPKGVLSSDLQTKLQTKSDPVSTKILITTDIQSKSQQTMSSAHRNVVPTEIQVKSQLTNLQEESLPLLTDITDKTTAQSDSSSGHSSQTVMMRVNSLGELELDPLFLSAEALSESETEEVRLTAPPDLTGHDRLTCNVLSGVGKSENLNVEEVQVDLQTHAVAQVEVGSANVNQSWFTSREDKDMLRWRGHAWRQGMWSREETELLKRNIGQYCAQRGVSNPGSVIFKMSKEERSGFYRVIARGLNRPLFSVYRRVIRLYDENNHMGKYTTEEVSKLRELRMKHGNNWQAIAAHLGRSAASVKDRCRLLNENCNRGSWSADEEDRLAAAVYDMAHVLPGEQVTSGISWGEVSSRVRTRSEKQCRTKWLNFLNWKRTSGVEWSRADDIQLICRLSVCGVGEESQVDWSALARIWPACRSPHWLRGKWWNLKRRLPQMTQEMSLREMCQQLYNMQSLNLLQSTLVELPATFLNSAANGTVLTATPPATPGNKSPTGLSQDSLSVGTIKLCIPAANFSHIINLDENEEDFGSRLSRLVQSALLAQSVDIRCCQPASVEVSQPHTFTSPTLTTQLTTQLPHLSTHLTSALSNGAKTQSIVVETMEDSLSMHLSEVTGAGVGRTTLLNQGREVKEEDILSDGEGAHSQAGLSTSLDPSSPAVTSQVIINDPILSVSGEPLDSEEGLQPDHDDSDMTCHGLSED
ncbi:uncharacterized protein [Panulirus ornatus]|uniref:uncharacterized protein isoform X3 n=1 Tax=Panulirus ornatus TaxID=150431 RepID=UPI003A8BCF74